MIQYYIILYKERMSVCGDVIQESGMEHCDVEQKRVSFRYWCCRSLAAVSLLALDENCIKLIIKMKLNSIGKIK